MTAAATRKIIAVWMGNAAQSARALAAPRAEPSAVATESSASLTLRRSDPHARDADPRALERRLECEAARSQSGDAEADRLVRRRVARAVADLVLSGLPAADVTAGVATACVTVSCCLRIAALRRLRRNAGVLAGHRARGRVTATDVTGVHQGRISGEPGRAHGLRRQGTAAVIENGTAALRMTLPRLLAAILRAARGAVCVNTQSTHPGWPKALNGLSLLPRSKWLTLPCGKYPRSLK